jgi:hypothetical protein
MELLDLFTSTYSRVKYNEIHISSLSFTLSGRNSQHLRGVLLKVFNNPEYMKIALECGEVVWMKGLVDKGYSICHGVSGNAYAFIELYKATQVYY